MTSKSVEKKKTIKASPFLQLSWEERNIWELHQISISYHSNCSE